MAEEDLDALERMVAAMEAKEREVVEREIASKFSKMRIEWRANAIEGGRIRSCTADARRCASVVDT